MPTLQEFYVTLKATWHCVRGPLARHLFHKAFSTSGKALPSVISNLSAPYACHDFTMQPFMTSSAQQCPLVLTLTSLRNEAEIPYDKFSLKGGGSMKKAEVCREQQAFPTCSPSLWGHCCCLVHWVTAWIAVGLQQCLHCRWVLFSYIMCIDFRHELTANRTLISWCNRPRS